MRKLPLFILALAAYGAWHQYQKSQPWWLWPLRITR